LATNHANTKSRGGWLSLTLKPSEIRRQPILSYLIRCHFKHSSRHHTLHELYNSEKIKMNISLSNMTTYLIVGIWQRCSG
jgi:hypothetical protein